MVDHFVPSPSSLPHTILNCVPPSPIELESNPTTLSHQTRTQSHTRPDHLFELNSVLTSNLRSISCLHTHIPTTHILIEIQPSATLILIITPLLKHIYSTLRLLPETYCGYHQASFAVSNCNQFQSSKLLRLQDSVNSSQHPPTSHAYSTIKEPRGSMPTTRGVDGFRLRPRLLPRCYLSVDTRRWLQFRRLLRTESACDNH